MANEYGSGSAGIAGPPPVMRTNVVARTERTVSERERERRKQEERQSKRRQQLADPGEIAGESDTTSRKTSRLSIRV